MNKQIRIHLKDGSNMTANVPEIKGDTLEEFQQSLITYFHNNKIIIVSNLIMFTDSISFVECS